jgi:hypothetical protein
MSSLHSLPAAPTTSDRDLDPGHLRPDHRQLLLELFESAAGLEDTATTGTPVGQIRHHALVHLLRWRPVRVASVFRARAPT